MTTAERFEQNPDVKFVLEGGGSRAAYQAGLLKSLQDAGIVADAVVGTSSGAVNAAFCASRQMENVVRLWGEYVPGTRFISWRRHLTPGAGPGLAVDEMLDDVIMGQGLLDVERATNGPTALYMTATDVETGEAVVAHPNASNLIEWMRASLAIPVGYNKIVTVDGRDYIDGGMATPMAFDSPLETPWNEPTVVILTRPMGVTKRPLNWWERFFVGSIVPKRLRDLSLTQHHLYNRVVDRLRLARDKGEVVVVEPPPDLPLGRITRKKAAFDAGIQMGFEVGARWADKLKALQPSESAPAQRATRANEQRALRFDTPTRKRLGPVD